MQDSKEWMRSGRPAGPKPRKLDTTVAYSARVNNYWQGGKDHFAADRAAAERARAAFPGLPEAVRAGGPWRRRVTRFLVIEGGIRQFLDLGAGLPAGDTIHQMAQALRPGCRVVYVDHDPMVLAHARALRPEPDASCGFVEADIRDTGAVLAAAAATLDLSQPVAVIASSVLHLVPAADDPYGMVGRYTGAGPAGSYLVIAHPSSDIRPEASAGMAASLNEAVAQKRTYRDHAQVSRFFAGLDLAEPGVVPLPQWRPDSAEEASAPTMAWAGVARKP
jgi:SAM-dependent methyltransferase